MSWFNHWGRSVPPLEGGVVSTSLASNNLAVRTHLIEARLRDVLAGVAIPADVQARIHQLFADAHAGELNQEKKNDVS